MARTSAWGWGRGNNYIIKQLFFGRSPPPGVKPLATST